MEDSQRKQELANARTKFATLQQRSLSEIAHEVGIKGIVSDMNSMGTEDWKRTSNCLYWLLNNTDYPYDKTILNLYADLDAIIRGHNDIKFI